MATYAGFQAAGILGGLAATLALVLPSVIIIILIARFLTNFSEKPMVKAVFSGVRPAVTALIAAAIWGLFRVVLVTETGTLAVKPLILCVVVFVMMQLKPLKKLHPAVWLLAAAVVGIVF
ncbi:MAG: chromate transporter, partial [Lachnospiraceae bacterium]|nr:chromate transporter [Lachnospiraceae bacterium]